MPVDFATAFKCVAMKRSIRQVSAQYNQTDDIMCSSNCLSANPERFVFLFGFSSFFIFFILCHGKVALQKEALLSAIFCRYPAAIRYKYAGKFMLNNLKLVNDTKRNGSFFFFIEGTEVQHSLIGVTMFMLLPYIMADNHSHRRLVQTTRRSTVAAS